MTRLRKYLLVGGLIVLGGLGGLVPSWLVRLHPQDRNFTVTAHKYAYEPSVLRVNRGDRVHIRLVAKDVTHGFYVEGYDLDAKARPDDPDFWVRHPSRGKSAEYQQVQEISFVADHSGKFRYRCSMTCGYMHPFMQGELIVRPNSLFNASIGLSLGLAAGLLLMFRRSGIDDPGAGE
jgi:heme/copper-type cytochrome/quinol oxidase subunit 2